jgi:aspartyl-tRNA(Asn)/glutamyl-tRNA(Gln) amidotransferase subunit A
MPTFGRVPKSGCTPLGYSLDHIGPMARTAEDCAALLQVLAGYDASDLNCANIPVPDFSATLTRSLDGVRIGVDFVHHRPAIADPAIAGAFQASLDELARLGAEIVEISLPHYAEMVAIDLLTMFGEALSYHMVDARSQWENYFKATRAMIGSGALFSTADFVQAQRVRRFVQFELQTLFESVDVVATPTASIPSPSYEMLNAENGVDVGEMFQLIHTAYWDPTGYPALSAPCGLNESGMPLSMQLAGRPFNEALLLNVAHVLQQETTWHRLVPPMTEVAVSA